MSYDWKNICVSPSDSVRGVLEKLDGEALRIALVVDESRYLKGVVTDGDVRRYLLKGGGLEDNVKEVMSTKFTSANPSASRAELIELMESKSILSIPILEEGRVVGLETLQQALVKPKIENPVFIMAGGFGTRLRPLTDNCPKPMLKVGDRPILEILISSFKSLGFFNFYISTHYMPEIIQNHFGDGSGMGINIQYIHEDKPLGTGGALSLLPENISDLPLIVINGDVLTNLDYSRLLDFHDKNAAFATMCVRNYEYTVPFGVVNGEGNLVSSMVEKPTYSYSVNAGIYVLSPELVKSVPLNSRTDMPELLERAIHLNKSVFRYPIHEYWLDIGRMSDFNKAQIDIGTLGLGND